MTDMHSSSISSSRFSKGVSPTLKAPSTASAQYSSLASRANSAMTLSGLVAS